jgi:hypothetical protein
MKTKSLLGLGVMVVIMVVGVVTTIAALSIGTSLSAHAQNTTTPGTSQQQQNQTADPQQVKSYLTQAIQALDSGNNTKALQLSGLAEDQLEVLTGTASMEDEEEEEEEGTSEDTDEPGDIDINDQEDTP